MSKECPSCGRNYYVLRKCNRCGTEFCNHCGDQKYVVVALIAACPDCGTDDADIISEDDEDSWQVERSDSSTDEDRTAREHDDSSTFSGGSDTWVDSLAPQGQTAVGLMLFVSGIAGAGFAANWYHFFSYSGGTTPVPGLIMIASLFAIAFGWFWFVEGGWGLFTGATGSGAGFVGCLGLIIVIILAFTLGLVR